MHSKKVQRSLDVFEHTQVMLQTIPRTRDPGMPKACRELCPLEQDEKLGPDPAAGSYQDSHAPDTCITMGKEAYGDFSSPWSCLDSRPLWKQKWSLKIPCSLCQLPKGSSHPMSPSIKLSCSSCPEGCAASLPSKPLPVFPLSFSLLCAESSIPQIYNAKYPSDSTKILYSRVLNMGKGQGLGDLE